MLSRIAFWGANKSTPVKHKHTVFLPACSSPIITEAIPACHLAGQVHENGQPITTQSVRYHSLSSTISFRPRGCFVPATSHARLNGVLGRTSMYETFLVSAMTSESSQRWERGKQTQVLALLLPQTIE